MLENDLCDTMYIHILSPEITAWHRVSTQNIVITTAPHQELSSFSSPNGYGELRMEPAAGNRSGDGKLGILQS